MLGLLFGVAYKLFAGMDVRERTNAEERDEEHGEHQLPLVLFMVGSVFWPADLPCRPRSTLRRGCCPSNRSARSVTGATS